MDGAGDPGPVSHRETPTATAMRHTATRPARRWRRGLIRDSRLFLCLAAALAPAAMAQNCISLSGSSACPAFSSASIALTSNTTSLFPFLEYVSDTASFDSRLGSYITGDYARQKYQQLLGCSSVDLSNSSDLYARYTTTVLCNAIVQNSASTCGLSSTQSRPLCADTCATFAESEESIASTPDICGTAGSNAINQIRADFTNCALPADSLNSQSCITGVTNEPTNCGFSDNLTGLCGYCAASSPNSTDSCCINSQAETRCSNVHLPTTTSMTPIFTSTATSRPTSSAGAGAGASHGLSAGAIAGIVVGAVLGALLLLALVIGACLLIRRRRRSSPPTSIFNQPSPSRSGVPATTTYVNSSRPSHQGPEPIPGARVARMTALNGTSSDEPPMTERRHRGYISSSGEEYEDSPESQRTAGMLAVANLPKRNRSLNQDNSSSSPRPETAPGGNNSSEYDTSPEGAALSGQSEQLPFFKDYYSQDEIRPNDLVATLWAYQPRANDEFELERGDMLKVVGIWDDGWATGVRVPDRVEDWENRRHQQRDSGVSNGSRRPGSSEGAPPRGGQSGQPGEIKAFPLVCVCLPQHWRKTIEGDTATETSGAPGARGGDDQDPPSSP